MPVVFDFLQPANAGREILAPFTLEDFDHKDLLDDFERQREVVLSDGAFVLELPEHQVQSIVPVLAAVFAPLEEAGKERLLFGVVADSLDGEVFDELYSLLVIERVLEYLSVHEVKRIHLNELCQQVDDLIDY